VSDLLLLGGLMLAFVGTHELLSHPLRAPLVARIGEKGFAILYSLVALACFGGAVQVWRGIGPEPLWTPPGPVYAVCVLLMGLASVLFVGSVTAPNPAMMPGVKGPPQGVQRITRHPMMWAMAIWGLVHITVTGDPRMFVLAGGVVTLALLGTAMQDRKKCRQNPAYAAHMAATSHVPFLAIMSGRQPLAALWPGLVPFAGGLVLFLAIGFAHPWLIGLPAFDRAFL
jgi:uncharacterized membrane protein